MPISTTKQSVVPTFLTVRVALTTRIHLCQRSLYAIAFENDDNLLLSLKSVLSEFQVIFSLKTISFEIIYCLTYVRQQDTIPI